MSETVDTESTTVSVPVALRRPCHQLSPHAIRLWVWREVCVCVVVLLPQLIGLFFRTTPWQVAGLAVTLVLGVIYMLVVPRWRYRVHRWELTPEALYTQRGWVTLRWDIAPISRIQNVNTVHGPLERRLGLATLTVTTASARGTIRLGGLDKDVAAELAAELTRVTHTTPGDAT